MFGGHEDVGHVVVRIVGGEFDPALGYRFVIVGRTGEERVHQEDREVHVEPVDQTHLLLEGSRRIAGQADHQHALADDVVLAQQPHRLFGGLGAQLLVQLGPLLVVGGLNADLHHAVARSP